MREMKKSDKSVGRRKAGYPAAVGWLVKLVAGLRLVARRVLDLVGVLLFCLRVDGVSDKNVWTLFATVGNRKMTNLFSRLSSLETCWAAFVRGGQRTGSLNPLSARLCSKWATTLARGLILPFLVALAIATSSTALVNKGS